MKKSMGLTMIVLIVTAALFGPAAAQGPGDPPAITPENAGEVAVIFEMIVTNPKWSPDGAMLAYLSADKLSLHVWDMQQLLEVQVFQDFENPVGEFAWSPDSAHIGTKSQQETSDADTLRIWNVASGAQEYTFQTIQDTMYGRFAWSPDGTLLAWIDCAGSDTHMCPALVRVVDMANGQELATFAYHRTWGQDLAWSPDGTLLAASSPGGDDTVYVFDVRRGVDVLTLYHGEGTPGLFGMEWSPDGAWILSQDAQNTHYIWNAASGTLYDFFDGEVYGDVTWSPTGALLVGRLREGGLHIIDPATLDIMALPDDVLCSSWSPDATLIAAGTRANAIRIVDPATWDTVRTFDSLTEWTCPYWSPGGTVIASISADYSIRLWDAVTGEQLTILQGSTDNPFTLSWANEAQLYTYAWETELLQVWGVPEPGM